MEFSWDSLRNIIRYFLKHPSMMIFQYSVNQLILIGFAMALGAAIQSAAGFGFSLFFVPLLLQAGVALSDVIIFSMLAQFGQQINGILYFRREIIWRPLMPVILSGVIFLCLGVILHMLFKDWDQTVLRRIIGVAILVIVIVLLCWQPTQRDNIHFCWGILSGACAGTMCGLIGIPGPPIVIWVIAHNWANNRSRASIWAIFIVFTPLVLFMLWLMLDINFLAILLTCLCFVPIILLGNYVGLRVGSLFSKKYLTRIIYALLICAAISTIFL